MAALETATTRSDRPLPDQTPETAPFWGGCARHAVALPRCEECGSFWYYPTRVCPHCSSTDLAWERVSGNGVVHTFTWVHRAAPGFDGLTPYALAIVELEEGPFVTTNVVGVGPEDIVIGLPVRVRYLDVASGLTLPIFEPAQAPGRNAK